MPLVALLVACGARYHATYSVRDVEEAFKRADFPVVRWPCGPNDGAKACFVPTRLRREAGSMFWISLRDTDHSGLLLIQTGTPGPSLQRDRLIQRVGNVVVIYDVAAEDNISGERSGPSLPPWVIPRIKIAAKLLREIRAPSE